MPTSYNLDQPGPLAVQVLHRSPARLVAGLRAPFLRPSHVFTGCLRLAAQQSGDFMKFLTHDCIVAALSPCLTDRGFPLQRSPTNFTRDALSPRGSHEIDRDNGQSCGQTSQLDFSKPLNIGIDCHIESPRAKNTVAASPAWQATGPHRCRPCHGRAMLYYKVLEQTWQRADKQQEIFQRHGTKPRAQGPPSARSEGRIPLNPCLNKSQREACGFSWTIAETVSVPVCPHKSPPSAKQMFKFWCDDPCMIEPEASLETPRNVLLNGRFVPSLPCQSSDQRRKL